jgi:hypothetical protein
MVTDERRNSSNRTEAMEDLQAIAASVFARHGDCSPVGRIGIRL